MAVAHSTKVGVQEWLPDVYDERRLYSTVDAQILSRMMENYQVMFHRCGGVKGKGTCSMRYLWQPGKQKAGRAENEYLGTYLTLPS